MHHRTTGANSPPAVATIREEKTRFPHFSQAQQYHRYRQHDHGQSTDDADQQQAAAAATAARPAASDDLYRGRQNVNDFHHHHHHLPRHITGEVHAQRDTSYGVPRSLATAAHTNQGYHSDYYEYDKHSEAPTTATHPAPISSFRRDDVRNPDFSSHGAHYRPPDGRVDHFERCEADPNISIGRYPPPVGGYDDALLLDEQQRQFLQQRRRRPKREGADESGRVVLAGQDRHHHHHHLESSSPSAVEWDT